MGSKHLPASVSQQACSRCRGGDINGCNKYLFSWDGEERFECNDIGPAPNATIVSATKDLTLEDGSVDTVISTECFEHDAQYPASLRKIVDLLSPGGVLVFTCASTGRPEHGTRRTSPKDCWATRNSNVEFQDYYKNLTIHDVAEVLDLDGIFERWVAYYHKKHKDLFFLGIKNGSPEPGSRAAPIRRQAHLAGRRGTPVDACDSPLDFFLAAAIQSPAHAHESCHGCA